MRKLALTNGNEKYWIVRSINTDEINFSEEFVVLLFKINFETMQCIEFLAEILDTRAPDKKYSLYEKHNVVVFKVNTSCQLVEMVETNYNEKDTGFLILEKNNEPIFRIHQTWAQTLLNLLNNEKHKIVLDIANNSNYYLIDNLMGLQFIEFSTITCEKIAEREHDLTFDKKHKISFKSKLNSLG